MREYYYRPPDLSGEKILETFLAFQDERDIPVTQEDVNNFFLNTFIDVCSAPIPEEVPNTYPVFRVKELEPIEIPFSLFSPAEENAIRKKVSIQIDRQPNLLYSTDPCYDGLYAEVLEHLISDTEPCGNILSVVVLPEAGDVVMMDDDTELFMPRIYLRVIE